VVGGLVQNYYREMLMKDLSLVKFCDCKFECNKKSWYINLHPSGFRRALPTLLQWIHPISCRHFVRIISSKKKLEIDNEHINMPLNYMLECDFNI